jgi:hypothetical protein
MSAFFYMIPLSGLVPLNAVLGRISVSYDLVSLHVSCTPGRRTLYQTETKKIEFATVVPVTLAVVQASVSCKDLGLMIFRSAAADPLQCISFNDVATPRTW